MIKYRSLEIIFLVEKTQFVVTEYKRNENIRNCQRKDIHSMQISLLSTIYFKGYFKR